MSAIAGIIHFHKEPVPSEQGTAMMNVLQKYPADDVRMWWNDNGNVFFGCHAQWITPESIEELLPYYDEERQLTITSDAIIDNREELFTALQVDYDRRKGMPDSQLILLAYAKWGEETPKHLIGDFAFMIWDERKQKLFGARDFSGTRTLYYIWDGERFAFCTTITPLTALPSVVVELNEEWLAEFLAITTSIDAVDTTATPYRGIWQIQPSHSISISLNSVKTNRYCVVTSNNRLKLNSNEEYVDAFKEIFQTAVNSNLRTFRGVGSHLSGGLDSGAVVSFAAKELRARKKTLNTYSYIPVKDFEDFTPSHFLSDESPYIRETVKFIGNINDQYLDFEGKDSFSEINGLLDLLERPYKNFENSYWIKGIFEKAQADGVGVLLSGLRGNLSVSWGSAIDYFALLLKRIRWVQLISELNNYSKNVGGSRLRRIRLVTRVAYPFLDRIIGNEAFSVPALINKQFANKTRVYTKLKDYGIGTSGWFATDNIFEQRFRHFHDVFHWNATNTLNSKMSLQHALYLRDPTNDIRVIRFCLSIPEDQFVHDGFDRSLIRRATNNLLPDTVRLNQRVRGIQGADWLHRIIPKWNVIVNEIRGMLSDSMISEYLNVETIRTALAKAEEGIEPELATDPNLKILMRSIIISRFIRKLERR